MRNKYGIARIGIFISIFRTFYCKVCDLCQITPLVSHSSMILTSGAVYSVPVPTEEIDISASAGGFWASPLQTAQKLKAYKAAISGATKAPSPLVATMSNLLLVARSLLEIWLQSSTGIKRKTIAGFFPGCQPSAHAWTRLWPLFIQSSAPPLIGFKLNTV